MSITLEVILNKTVLIGLSYFDKHGELLQQRLLSGLVVESDAEKGIAIKLDHAPLETANNAQANAAAAPQHFVLPSALSCWFHAPRGEYHTSSSVKIKNPDYLVTWDIYQKQDSVEEGDHQWWEWQPRTVPPQVNNQQTD
ncbi:MAG: hypothetical protein MI976_05560 [Pseudomonadales bacterium]|nr:hypothetical protein [Pseudomonadales bacterium]